jgi:hypothetical protein
LAAEARQLASSHEIDLPAAYSIVLGTMSLAEVQAVQVRAAVELPPMETAPATGGNEDSYDPDFEPAVREGHLTPAQACRRGRRIAYAESIANRYGLPMAAAYDVADNRISLLLALWQNPAPASATVELGPARQARATLHWAFAGAAVLLVFAAYFRPGPAVSDERNSATRRVGSVEVRTDASGRITLVAAADPRSVLDGYCSAHESEQLRPLGVIASVAASRDARLGLFRRAGTPSETLSIDILENRRAQRWIAGDGVTPIVEGRAPQLSPSQAAR